jgi:biopolymer transport protein ExbD
MPKVESLERAASRHGGRRARGARVSSSLAEINVVPLVDVMLVLLVIFMVAAPMMQQGFPVQLPQSRRAQAIDQSPVTVTVPATFRRDRRVRIGEESVSLSVLAERVRQELDGRTQRGVVLAADGAVTWQEVVSVIDEVKAGGATNVGAQTQPPVPARSP